MKTLTEINYLELLQKYRAIIYSVCLKYGGENHARVEELHREVAIALWKEYSRYGLSRFNHQCSESTWIYRFSELTVLYYLRQQKGRGGDILSMSQYQIENIPYGVNDERLADSELEVHREELQWMIRQLEVSEQELLTYKLEGYRYGEIAQKLGISETAVGTRLSRIVEKLKTMSHHKGSKK